jgi:hypothetical protein
MTDYEKQIVARLMGAIDNAGAVSARDHSRMQDGGRDSYAYDFGALEMCVRLIGHEALVLARQAGIVDADRKASAKSA